VPEEREGVPSIPLSVVGSRQGGHGVGPGLDEPEDGIVTVGGDADLGPGEGHEVSLPGRIVALQGRGVGLPLRIVHGVAAHGRGDLGVGEDLGLHGCEGRGGRGTHVEGADGLGVVILVEDAGSVVLPGLGDRVDGHAAYFVGGAPEGVGADDTRRDGCKRGGVRNRGGQSAYGTLGDALLDKVCHCLMLLPLIEGCEQVGRKREIKFEGGGGTEVKFCLYY